MRCCKARRVRSDVALADVGSTTGGTGLSDDGIRSPLACYPLEDALAPLTLYGAARGSASPEQNGPSAVYRFHEGGDPWTGIEWKEIGSK